MFTLIYNKGQFNRPDTLVPFLQSNIGEYPLLQVDCITPFPAIKEDLIQTVCEYLSKIEPDIEVTPDVTRNPCAERSEDGKSVDYLALQVHVERTKERLL